jgi:hypothetical protein
MHPRNRSLLCSCIVLATMLAWLIRKPAPEMPTGTHPAESAHRPAPGPLSGPFAAAIDSLPVAHRQQAPEISMPLPQDFLQSILSTDASGVTIPLPGGGQLSGTPRKSRRDENGLLMLEGDITHPQAGRFYFHRQTIIGKAGALFGFIHFDRDETAYQVRPSGRNGAPMLVKTTVDKVMCRAFAAPPDVREIPAAHPTDDPIPAGENGVIQLQSLPGAAAVVYLDFDGEERDFEYWGPIDAAPSGATNGQIFEIWQGVCEDFMPFNINVTTIRGVYDAATPGHRMQVVVTPTDDAQPGAGGVAITSSFNNTGEIVCWSFLTTGKNAIEVISHEVGHTLGLSHDGKISPFTEYYAGHNGWAPIMGVGYNQALTQWSKGEYLGANNLQDDLLIITNTNNGVDYLADDHPAAATTATWLTIDAGGLVSNEGIIETNTDRDSFRFSTNGGLINLQINPVPPVATSVAIANLDIKAELLSVTSTLSTVIATSNSTATLAASFSNVFLDPGDYLLRVSGTGKGNPLTTGYTHYACLGSYTVGGFVDGGIHSEQFTLAENPPDGTPVGSVPPRADHDNGALIYEITGGNPAFAIHPSNGLITVADGTLLDFESINPRPGGPAAIELFINISDSKDYAVETIRAVVFLTDVNEPPSFPTPPAIMLPERSPAGTFATSVNATDPDRGDFVTYSIIAGNESGAFAIHPATGVITVAGALDHQTAPTHTLTLRASDQLAPVNTADATLDIQIVPVPGGFDPGSVVRTFFSGIPGAAVDDLTNSPNFPDKPNSEVILSSFQGGASQGIQYGSTMRGWMIAPASGDYTFWISANDSASLFISTDDDPQNAILRAAISSATSPGVWDQESGQQSAAIPLVAGGVYFIEARHKQSFGGDHLQVAWQGPGMPEKQIIPGTWLVPYHQPYAPWAAPQSFDVREASAAGTLVGRVSFIEPNLNEEVASHAITGGNEQGNFTIDPVSGDIRVAGGAALTAGSAHVLTISATDDATPAATGETTVAIGVKRLDEGLHAWWKLDETAGTNARDASGSNRDAILTGGGAWVSRDTANPALELNGTDARLSRYDYEALFGDTPFTVAAWVRVPVSHDSEGVLIHQVSGFINGVERSFKVSVTAGGNVRFRIHETDLSLLFETDQFDITTTETIHDGTWHHVACVRDGETGRIFIDGVESVSASGPVISMDIDAYTTVGCDALDFSDPLAATVDDVRIYAEALAAPQLVRIAGAPKIAIVHPAPDIAVIPPGVGLLLQAGASDPDGPVPPISWSQAGGPGIVTFGSPVGAETTAEFSAPGTYILRANASDGVDDSSATLTVLAGNTTSSPFAGFAYGGATVGSLNNLAPQAYEIEGTSIGISGGANEDGFYLLGQSFTGDFDLSARVSATYDDGFGEPWGTAGLVVRAGTAGLPGEAGGFIGFNAPAGAGTWVRRETTGAPNVETTYPGLPLPQWCRVTRTGDSVEFWHSPDGASWTSRGTMTFAGEIRAGLCWSSNSQFVGGSALFDNVSGFSTSNVGASVSAGADFPAQTGLPAPLTGQATDDGLPDPPAATTISWELLAGPGSVDVTEPAQAATTAVFSQAGVYQMRLIADDGALRTFDDVTITVTDPPPLVSVAATSPAAAETGPQAGTFTFTRGNWLPGDITVNFTLSGTAGNGADYQEITGGILMPDGVETVTLDVVPIPDELLEGPETVILTLTAGDYDIAGDAAVVTIQDTNLPPSFPSTPLAGGDATQDLPYSGSLAGTATDPNAGDTLVFSISDGPAWLIVGEDGTLSGTPENADVGPNSFTIRVTDSAGAFAEAQLDITVLNVNDEPAFAADPIIGGDAIALAGYNGTLAATATDPDAGDTLVFSKTDGPPWLIVNEDGSLSGTPAGTDVGINLFTVAVTDLAGAVAFTTLRITVLPPPVVSVAATGPAAAETGPQNGVFTITRSGSTFGDLTVDFTLTGSAINGVDYVGIPGSVLIPGGEESVTITVIPQADEFIEGTETVVLALEQGAYEIGEPSSAFVSISDSNHAPFFLADPVVAPNALEGAPYTGESLADHAGDPNLDDGDTLTFLKISGPDWLSIAEDGALSGAPGTTDLGINLFTVRVTDAAGLTADGSLRIIVTAPTTFESWQLAEFAALSTDPLVAGELADPDRDGRSNLLEYALATDPNQPDVARVEWEMVDIAGTDFMRVTYFINPEATDINLQVEATADLADPGGWSDQNLLIEDVTTARIVVRDTLGGPLLFFRLRASR